MIDKKQPEFLSRMTFGVKTLQPNNFVDIKGGGSESSAGGFNMSTFLLLGVMASD